MPASSSEGSECDSLVGAVGVVLAAMLFSRLGSAWTFGLAGTGMTLLPLLFSARLRQRAVSSLKAP